MTTRRPWPSVLQCQRTIIAERTPAHSRSDDVVGFDPYATLAGYLPVRGRFRGPAPADV
ncbi:MAG TPA: hypothetical protein VKZ50_20835 [bacterium]|nr:hypothetical protein [bacterium]